MLSHSCIAPGLNNKAVLFAMLKVLPSLFPDGVLPAEGTRLAFKARYDSARQADRGSGHGETQGVVLQPASGPAFGSTRVVSEGPENCL